MYMMMMNNVEYPLLLSLLGLHLPEVLALYRVLCMGQVELFEILT